MIQQNKLIGYPFQDKGRFPEGLCQNRDEKSAERSEVVDFSDFRDVLREDCQPVYRHRATERFLGNSCGEIAGVTNGDGSSGSGQSLCFPGNIPREQKEISVTTCAAREAKSPNTEDQPEITSIHAASGAELKKHASAQIREEIKKKIRNPTRKTNTPPVPGLVMENPEALLACFTCSTEIIHGISGVGNDGTVELSAWFTASFLPNGSCADVHQDDRQIVPFFNSILWARHCEASRLDGAPVRFDYFNAEKDRYYDITVLYFRHATTGMPCCAWTVRDMSVQHRTESLLGLTVRKLNLVNSIALHEIQNKITGIRGYVELSKQADTDGMYSAYIRAEEIALSQIHEILQYCAEYQDIGTSPRRWFNVKEAIHAAVSLMEIEGFHTEMKISGLEVLADPLLGKVFACLVRYSVKTANGTPSIRIHYDKIPDGLCLVYEDSGVGLPRKDNRNLFVEDLIKTEDFCMKFVHDILDFSGMKIEAVGGPGHGLRLIIRIPDGQFRFSSGLR